MKKWWSWGQLNDSPHPAWLLDFKISNVNLFPDLFPRLGFCLFENWSIESKKTGQVISQHLFPVYPAQLEDQLSKIQLPEKSQEYP
jgi:hypothetical protein